MTITHFAERERERGRKLRKRYWGSIIRDDSHVVKNKKLIYSVTFIIKYTIDRTLL
jgi:hypothetical protein